MEKREKEFSEKVLNVKLNWALINLTVKGIYTNWNVFFHLSFTQSAIRAILKLDNLLKSYYCKTPPSC